MCVVARESEGVWCGCGSPGISGCGGATEECVGAWWEPEPRSAGVCGSVGGARGAGMRGSLRVCVVAGPCRGERVCGVQTLHHCQ
eukprot:1106524-Rhodomonas_salina.1